MRPVYYVRLILGTLFFAGLMLLTMAQQSPPYQPPPIPTHFILHCRTDTISVPRYWRDQTGQVVHTDEVLILLCPEQFKKERFASRTN